LAKCTAKDYAVWHDMLNRDILESRIRDWSNYAVNHGLKIAIELFDTYKLKDCQICLFTGILFKLAFSIRFYEMN